MKGITLIILVLIFWIVNLSSTFGQIVEPFKSIISIENKYLIAKYDNPIRIVAQQNEPVSIKQLNATIQLDNSEKLPIEITEGIGYFIIRPDTFGAIELNITIGDTIETKTLRVRPLEGVGCLGIHKANQDEKISIGEFKAQIGIAAYVECCGFDARCIVLGYQMIRISNRNQIDRTVNKGARFDENTRRVIMKAESGDIYIFGK